MPRIVLFKPLLDRETRRRLRGPEHKEERDALKHEARCRRFPPDGVDPFWRDLGEKVGPAILKGLQVLLDLGVRMAANNLMESSGSDKHAFATDLVLKLSGSSREDFEDYAAEAVERTFRHLKDAGELE